MGIVCCEGAVVVEGFGGEGVGGYEAGGLVEGGGGVGYLLCVSREWRGAVVGCMDLCSC